jgi:hypothetical protein
VARKDAHTSEQGEQQGATVESEQDSDCDVLIEVRRVVGRSEDVQRLEVCIPAWQPNRTVLLDVTPTVLTETERDSCKLISPESFCVGRVNLAAHDATELDVREISPLPHVRRNERLE